MKLTMVLLTAAFLQVQAAGFSQAVTISGKDLPLDKVFNAIKTQTGFKVFFTMDALATTRPVTFTVYKMPLSDFLEMTLKDQPLSFRIGGETVFISRKNKVDSISNENETMLVPPGIIKGRVLDKDGSPLAGASIVVKGTKTSTSTDEQGRFSISVDAGSLLIISYIGFTSKEIKVNGDNISIILAQSTSELDQIQIGAYTNTTRRNQLGNVTSIKAKDIENQPVNNPLLALQGRVPSLSIVPANGLPGAGVVVRNQGRNSFAGGLDPLYVIDGVPYAAQTLTTTGRGAPWGGTAGGGSTPYNPGGAGNPMSYLNSSDIESIDVLKDADATAIYGSRAANGAILITTKKGKAGPARVNLNAQSGWGKVTKKIGLLNTSQYITMRKEAMRNDNTVGDSSNAYPVRRIF